jgi:GntR family transcriptional regulator
VVTTKLTTGLLAALGYSSHTALDDISVRGATDTEAGLLELSAGDPVIVVFRTTFSEESIPFEVSVMVMTPEGRHLRYPLSAG